MAGTFTPQNLTYRDGRHFVLLRDALPGGDIYNRSPSASPYRTDTIQFEGNAVAPSYPTTVHVYRDDALVSSVTTDANGNFSVGVRINLGRNKIHCTLGSGTVVGAATYIDAYTWGTIFAAYATMSDDFRALLDQALQDTQIDDGVDLDGNAITTSDRALRDNFGQFVRGRRFVGMTRAEYQQFIKDQLEAYRNAPSIYSLDLICLAYLGVLPTFIFLRDTSYAFSEGGGVKFRVRTPPSFTVDYNEWEFWLYNRWFKLPAGSYIFDPAKRYWVYVDGDVVNYNELELKVMEIANVALDFPFREAVSRAITIPQAEILTDTDGTKTGIANTLYIAADRIPLSVTSISGSVYGTLSDADVIGGTGWISLGVQFQASDIGDISLTFTYCREPRILARVTTDGSAVTAIEYQGRWRDMTAPDGTTNGLWAFEDTSLANEMIGIFPNYQLLTTAQQDDFDALIRQVKPAHKLILRGDNYIIPSPEFPAPLSLELGATLRCQEPPLKVLSAELGATRRGHLPPSPFVLEFLMGEMGSTNRENDLS